MAHGRAALAVALALVVVAPAEAAGADVVRSEYSLGDAAFQVAGFHDGSGQRLADIELTAVVHRPARMAGRRPLVVLAHGHWQTCRDGQWRWPCVPGTAAFPSYRGYDYLGEALARQGSVVVSVSANGVNAGESGQAADIARSALVGKHLEMWRELAAGRGPLAGKLTGFTGHVDLGNVGIMGHSRGGRGVMWQASDNHAADIPTGVRIRAILPLAPAEYYAPDPEAPENLDYRVTKIPFAVLTGSCDGAVTGGDYFVNAKGRNTVPIHRATALKANHNYFNTEWSYTNDSKCPETLSPQEQRRLATKYVPAFFRRYLNDDHTADPIVSRGYPGVEVETALPVTR